MTELGATSARILIRLSSFICHLWNVTRRFTLVDSITNASIRHPELAMELFLLDGLCE